MYWPDTGTGVDTEPARKPVASAVRKYFTEGGAGVPPTVPGGDWFNAITNEVLNVLDAAGIDPSKTDDDQLLLAIQRISKAMSAREALRRTYAEAGFNLVPGSFELGGTVTTATDVLLYEADGHAYNWDGVFPGGGKVVPQGSTPASTGGVGPDLWVDKYSSTFRDVVTSSQGASTVGIQSVAPGKTVQNIADDWISIEKFRLSGETDYSLAIERATGSGENFTFPVKDSPYDYESDMHTTQPGQSITGSGALSVLRYQGTSPGASPIKLLHEKCKLAGLSLVGNANVEEMVVVAGAVDDGLVLAARNCEVSSIWLEGITSGLGMRVSSWENKISRITCKDSHQGLNLGTEANGNSFDTLYLTNLTGEALKGIGGSGQPAVNVFNQLTAQYCNSDEAVVDFSKMYGVEINGLYLEGNNSPVDVRFDSLCHNVNISAVMHNLVSGSVGKNVIETAAKAFHFAGGNNLGGDISSFIKIVGTLPVSVISSVPHMSAGAASNGVIDDTSTSKATIILDPVAGAVLSEYFKATRTDVRIGTTPVLLTTAGSTLRLDYSAGGLGSLSALLYRIGSHSGNVTVRYNAGNPEGGLTADPGSLCLTNLGKFYFKATGTGNTGWREISFV